MSDASKFRWRLYIVTPHTQTITLGQVTTSALHVVLSRLTNGQKKKNFKFESKTEVIEKHFYHGFCHSLVEKTTHRNISNHLINAYCFRLTEEEEAEEEEINFKKMKFLREDKLTKR